jgi:nucleotide-binding universal stress UspA family protein
MYRKMLVLLDGSKLAEVVFTYAQEVSARMNISLELLHVCSPQEAEQLPMRKAYMEHMAEELQNTASEIRSKIGSETPVFPIKAVGKVVVGYPAEEILKYADENEIDLIMLSTHGRSGERAWDIGNVANKVIHASKVPIWLVPTELREEIIYDKLPRRLMIIPLSGSQLSEAVIPHALNIAKQRGTEADIVFVHVASMPASTYTFDYARRQQAENEEKKKYLGDVVKRVDQEGVKARAEILFGEPADALINYVKDNPAQLIVMATHGHAGLSSMIFGSVTENIIHLVKKTPIFLVKP